MLGTAVVALRFYLGPTDLQSANRQRARPSPITHEPIPDPPNVCTSSVLKRSFPPLSILIVR